ncbi:MAG: methyltransferase domain-containing protein [Burkholderiales bacterium]
MAIPDFNEMLHRLRGYMLRETGCDGAVLLSAGASGSWYFDWINEFMGTPSHHIAIELYSPKPDALPPEVTWIASSVSDMSLVTSESVDVIFSGQNIEHLWPEDIVGFLLETNRVCSPNGAFIVDSPNRRVTSQLNWCHPEHLIEFTPDEMKAILTAAGFAVRQCVGLWRCIDNEGLPLLLDIDQAGWPVERRIFAGRDSPDESFIWWIVAEKQGKADSIEVRRMVIEVSQRAWRDRCGRFSWLIGRKVVREGVEWIEADTPETGYILYGPYIPLRAGKYKAKYFIECNDSPAASTEIGSIDVSTKGQSLVELDIKAPLNNGGYTLPFSLKETTFGVEFRVFSKGACALRVKRSIELEVED